MIIRQSPDVPNIIGNVGTLTGPVTMQEATSELANIHIGTRCQKVSVHCIKSRLEGVFEVVSNREKRGVDKKYASQSQSQVMRSNCQRYLEVCRA